MFNIYKNQGFRKLIFVYSKKFRYSGSTIMRGEQLSDIAKAALGDKIQVEFAPINRYFKNSDLFLTKGALAVLPPGQLERWKKRGNRLFFDLVDSTVSDDTAKFADTIVAASHTAYLAYKKKFPGYRVVLVNHHVDPRISKPTKQHKVLKVGYFGELVNTIITPAIREMVHFVHVDTSRRSVAWLRELENFNFHYAIRQINDYESHKPFLKGFTAAYCQANILIQNDQQEAIYWLGSDYPYLLKKPITEKNILEALKHASESYKSKEWFEGLARMESIKQRVSPQTIGAELQELFS